jgi:triphosphoribosyl-dephospho-CoA synthase
MLLTGSQTEPRTGRDPADRVATAAHDALIAELCTWPKPGLVSPVDNGSHRDMTAATLARSASAIRPFFAMLARAGETGAAMSELRRIGVAAEAAMAAATGGVNAHRGAIFSIGLLCAAQGRLDYRASSAGTIGRTVTGYWGDAILADPPSATSHGGRASRRYGVGGARKEAAHGFPTVLGIGLPALRDGRVLAPADPEASRVHCLFALLGEVADTNILHRGGLAGLRFARDQARAFLREGSVGRPVWREHAKAVHQAFVARNLSPGGCADLLATTLFLDRQAGRRA